MGRGDDWTLIGGSGLVRAVLAPRAWLRIRTEVTRMARVARCRLAKTPWMGLKRIGGYCHDSTCRTASHPADAPQTATLVQLPSGSVYSGQLASSGICFALHACTT